MTKLLIYPYRFICSCLRSLRNIMLFIFLSLFFVILFSLIGLYYHYESENQPPMQAGILVLDLKGSIVDDPLYDSSIYQLLTQLDQSEAQLKQENSLFELIKKIKQASHDSNIKALVIQLDELNSVSFTSLYDIANALTEFKQQHKKIYAIGSHYDLKRYYLASTADEIEFLPQGQLDLYGLNVDQFYFKSLLDHLSISAQVFKVGDYKSAVEPFTRDNMSVYAKENLSRWVNLLWENYLTEVSVQRNIPKEKIVPESTIFVEQLKKTKGDIALYALKNGIIDNLMPQPIFDELLKQRYLDEPLLSIYDYVLHKESIDHPLISVVFVEGTISDGVSSQNVAGAKTINKALNEAVEKNSAAIVLRINSPGGGVFASESIRQTLKAIRKKGIPIVVSMGTMAASGGYWIATESDYIYANKNTLTGSIGIFGIIPNIEKALNKIGVYNDGVKTSQLVEPSIVKPLTSDMSEVYQLQIEHGYQTFISLVAVARHLTEFQVEQIAQGQVWLGQEALNHHLVDEIGSLESAIQKSALLANLSEYSVAMPKHKLSFLDKLLFSTQAILPQQILRWLNITNPFLIEMEKSLTLLSDFNDPKNQYLYCLSCYQ